MSWLSEVLAEAKRHNNATEAAGFLSSKLDDTHGQQILHTLMSWVEQMYGYDYKKYKEYRGTNI
jgi:hypothetical protein